MFNPTNPVTANLLRDGDSYLNSLRDLADQIDAYIARMKSQPVLIRIQGVDEVTPLVDRIVADIGSRTLHLPLAHSQLEPHHREHLTPQKTGSKNINDVIEAARQAIELLPHSIAALPGKMADFAARAKKTLPDLAEQWLENTLRAEKHPELAQSYHELYQMGQHQSEIQARMAKEKDPQKRKSLQKELDQTKTGIKRETAHIQAQQKLIDAMPPQIGTPIADINERTKEFNLRAGNQPKAARLARIQYDTEKRYTQAAGDPARQAAILSKGMAQVKDLAKGRTEVGFSDPLSSWHKMQQGGESIKAAAEKLEKLFGDAKPFSVVTMQPA